MIESEYVTLAFLVGFLVGLFCNFLEKSTRLTNAHTLRIIRLQRKNKRLNEEIIEREKKHLDDLKRIAEMLKVKSE